MVVLGSRALGILGGGVLSLTAFHSFSFLLKSFYVYSNAGNNSKSAPIYSPLSFPSGPHLT